MSCDDSGDSGSGNPGLREFPLFVIDSTEPAQKALRLRLSKPPSHSFADSDRRRASWLRWRSPVSRCCVSRRKLRRPSESVWMESPNSDRAMPATTPSRSGDSARRHVLRGECDLLSSFVFPDSTPDFWIPDHQRRNCLAIAGSIILGIQASSPQLILSCRNFLILRRAKQGTRPFDVTQDSLESQGWPRFLLSLGPTLCARCLQNVYKCYSAIKCDPQSGQSRKNASICNKRLSGGSVFGNWTAFSEFRC